MEGLNETLQTFLQSGWIKALMIVILIYFLVSITISIIRISLEREKLRLEKERLELEVKTKGHNTKSLKEYTYKGLNGLGILDLVKQHKRPTGWSDADIIEALLGML